MKKMHQFLAIIIAAMVFSLVACDKQGPAEKAGESVDKAADKAFESTNKAMDNTYDAAKDVKEKAEETMDKMKD